MANLRVLPRDPRPACRVVDLVPERGLVGAVLPQLREEMPSLALTIDGPGPFDAIWACGFDGGSLRVLRELRERYPQARIVVTSGLTTPGWERGVLEAGADHALRWPTSYAVLASLLRGERDRFAAVS